MALLIVAAAVAAVLVRSHTINSFTVIYFCVLIPSVILHEVSHGVVANWLGDDTAKRAGRLTLNPLAHVDPVGTIVVPAVLVLTSGVAFGWAKPVPVNVGRLRHPRNGSVWVSLAGPATNALLFVAAALVFRFLEHRGLWLSPTDTTLPLVGQVLLIVGIANIWVCVFNLLPVPPLDGSAVVERLVPDRHLHTYYRIRPFGMVAVLLVALLVLQQASVATHVFDGALHLWNAVAGTNVTA